MIELEIIEASEKWVRDQSISKNTYEVERAFRAGIKHALKNSIPKSEAISIISKVFNDFNNQVPVEDKVDDDLIAECMDEIINYKIDLK